MSREMIFLAVFISAACTFFLRALPFLAFHGEKRIPESLEQLGMVLPAAIMAVLIVYCLKDIGDDFPHIFVPRILSVAVVACSYKWKHNTMASILLGTLCHMALLRIL